MSMKLEEFARESRATHKGDKSGVPIVGLEHLIPQEIKFSGYDVDTENTFTKTFKKGQILFGRRRAYLKKAAIADFDGICSGDITVIEAIPGKVDPLLLPFIIQNDKFFDYAVSRSAGGLSPRVKWEHLKDYEFDLPPIEEQRILADKLWAAYRLKESYKKLLTATQEMVKSQFIEMYYNTHNKQTLESVCPIMNKGITPKYVESSSVLVINQACIHWDGQRLGNIKYHNEEIPVRKRILESGDVLLNATGNGTLGRCCVFICPSDNNTYINDGHVIALSTDRAVILPEVLNTYLSLNDTQAEIYRQYVTGSTNQVDIVFSDIKKMKVPVPSMDEQILFVEVLTQADKSEFVGCKSQFIEMFGDTHMRSDHSRQWKEVVEIINGKDYKSIQVEDGGYPVYGTGGEMARASDYLSPANSILLGRKGTIDKPLLIREKYWNVDTAFGAVPDEKVLHYVYFYWHCKTIDFNVLNKGTTLPSTTKVDLLNLWIKIPSMEEQTRFGSIVEQADKSEFVGCKSQFIEIFYGMETTPVKDYIDDSFPGEWGTEDKDGNGVKVIRTTNFTNSGKLNLADVVTRSIEDRKVVRKQIKKYDTILERSGGTADNPVGRVVLFEEDNLFLCNNFTQVLRFKDVDPRFAFYALYYFYQTNRTAIRSMGSKTTGIQNLNMSKYLEIGIPNASDEDQKAFVTIAEQADKSEFELRKSIEAIDQVIKSLINN